MMIFILLLQALATLIIFRLTWWAYKKFNLKINWHNLPIILICFALVLAGTLLAYKNIILYLPVGILLGLFIWTLNSIEVNNQPKLSLSKKLLVSLIVCLIWPQIMVFMIFYGVNYDSINIDEES